MTATPWLGEAEDLVAATLLRVPQWADASVAGIIDAAGDCAPGLVEPVPTPMVHVWIEPHRCGPFAALEGIAGGRIPDGETRLCDHAHGA